MQGPPETVLPAGRPFVRLSPGTGSVPGFCTHHPGGSGIAVNSAGNAYVTGDADSTQDTFPVTVGPDLTHNGRWDAFVAKVVELSPVAYLPLVVRGN